MARGPRGSTPGAARSTLGRVPGTGSISRATRLAAVLLAAVVLPGAAEAGAETREVGCAQLRGAVEGASGAETVVLHGMCHAADLGGSGIAIPAGTSMTLRGAAGTVSGIDGTAIAGALLSSTEAGPVSIEGLTFQNAGAAGAVRLRAQRVAIVGDSFLSNAGTEAWGGGLFVQTTGSGCPGAGGPAAIALESSTFRGNTLTHDGETAMGAGAYLQDTCPGAGATIEGNVFEGNVLRAENAEDAAGAGLFAGAEGVMPAPVTQRGNLFARNRVEDLVAPHFYTGGRFGGGGEWLEGMSLSSVGDRFTANTVQGSLGAHPSGGAGLGLASGPGALESLQTVTCGHGAPASATLEDDVLDANSIAGGTAQGADGAGVEIGCGEAGGALSLLDSTVTANSSPAGGAAGGAGGATAVLTLANTILAWNDGPDIGGFGGSISSAYSDVCQAGGSAPVAGDHDVCVQPALSGVDETALSPTREAGSNALVPPDLTTDFHGQPRIAGGTLQATCREGVVQIAPPIVDIGADEYPEPLLRALHVECARPFTRSAFTFPAVAVRRDGALLLTFRGLRKGTVVVEARTRFNERPVRRAHRRTRGPGRTVKLFYGRASRTGQLPSPMLLRLSPTARALHALRRRRRLTVSLSVTYAADRLYPATQSRTITVRLRPRG